MSETPDTRAQLVKALQALQKTRQRLETLQARQHEPIAIVGMACRVPGADSPEAFWQQLRAGTDRVGPVPASRWDRDACHDPQPATPGRTYVRDGAFLDGDIAAFDAAFFGISPREAALLDPQQRLLLEVAWEALERAGIAPATLRNSRTGVFVGVTPSEYLGLIDEAQRADTYATTGNSPIFAAGRLSYVLGLQGPSLVIDTACSASLIGVHQACESLRRRTSDLALAGGSHLMVTPQGHIVQSQLQALAADGRCKTFDAAADGYGRGEGCGLVVLKRLSDAQAAGDLVLAVIRGSATNHDGPSSGLTVPSATAQAALICQALADGQVEPQQVSYVEAHGTGTRLGDPIEMRALASVFGERQAEQALTVGAVKAGIGHLEEAAGVTGLIKVVLMLQHGEIPPQPNLHTPSPHIDWCDGRLRVVTAPTPWNGDAEGRRIAGVSSFGLGGANAHVVLEQAPVTPAVAPETGEADSPRWHLLTLSARHPAALRELARRHAAALADLADADPADLCASVATGRNVFGHRLALVGDSAALLRERLQAWAEAPDAAADVHHGIVPPQGAPRLAFLFAGQGAQYLQMGRRLFETEPVFRTVIARCEPVMQAELGRSLVELLYPDALPAHRDLIDSHPCGQAANFALECALAALWRHRGVMPAMVLGHSLGDYAAACVAGVMSVEDGLRLVIARGRLMARAQGRMVSAIASEAQVRRFIAGLEDIDLAAVNGPQSVVISGGAGSIARVAEAMQAEGLTVRDLAIPVAAHSPLLDPVLDEFSAVLATVRLSRPQLPVVSGMSGQRVDAELTDPAYWRRHLRATVRFADGVATLHAQGCRLFLEIGPQATLAGMAGQVIEALDAAEPAAVTAAVTLLLPSLRQGEDDVHQMLDSLAALQVRGAVQETAAEARPAGHRRLPLPTYPFQRTRHWAGPVTAEEAPVDPAVQDDAQVDALLHRTVWRDRGAWGMAAAVLRPVGQILPLLQAETHWQLDGPALRPALDAVARLERACVTPVLNLFAQAGRPLRAGEGWSEDEAARALGVASVHRRLFTRLLALLTEDGWLRQDGPHWTVLRDASPQDADLDAWATSLSAQVGEAAAIEGTLLARFAPALPALLRGEAEALPLLFQDDAAERLYRQTAAARLMNTLVEAAVERALEALPADHGLRVLEIGAGTGGTTAGLLPRLAAWRPGRLRYTFTDKGAAFVKQAGVRFAAHVATGCLDRRTLDIEQSPAGQGFLPGQQDVVIAANVLHATQDLRASLRHALDLLAPGGLLVLLEASAARRWIDLSFGLTEGWWRAADERQGHPLLPSAAWQSLLAEVGFQTVGACPDAGWADGALGQVLLLARAPAARAVTERVPAPPRWLILGDADGLADRLVDGLRRRGQSAGVLTADAIARLAEAPDVQGVICLPDLAGTADEAGAVRPALAVVQALVRRPGPAPRLWLVTRDAQPVLGNDPVSGAGLASWWGLASTLAIEHPELASVCIDLDGRVPAAAQAEALLAALGAPVEDNRLALRGGRCQVARLVRHAEPQRPAMRLRAEATYLITGGLGGLGRAVARWMLGQGARHLLLLARRPPSVEQAQDLQSLQSLAAAAGGGVRLAVADVADSAALAAVLAGIDAAHPLAGVLHAAAAGDTTGLLLQTDAARVAAVLAPKVLGAVHLDALTRELPQPLDFFVAFSSITALTGDVGLGAYAAANAALDALCARRRAAGLPGLAIGWGIWADVGAAAHMDPDRARHLSAQGHGRIAAAQGLAALGRLLGSSQAQVAVMPLDRERLRRRAGVPSLFDELLADDTVPVTPVASVSSVPEPAAESPDAAAPTRRQQFERCAAAERPALLAAHVAQLVGRVLRLPRGEALPDDESLLALGMDSLMAVELRNHLRRHWGIDIAFARFLQGLAARDIVAELMQRLDVSAPAAAETPAAAQAADDDWITGSL